jgi:hypothetical protein
LNQYFIIWCMMWKTIDFPKRAIPPLAVVKQHLLTDRIEEVRGETRQRLLDAGLRQRIQPHARIAITAGSRGMGGFVESVSGIVETVLSLTPESLGNGLGIGLADFTTRRFMDEYDPAVTYVNLLTATEPGAMNCREGLLPLALPTDREAIEVALFSSLASERPRLCRIKNTACLDEFWVSEALLGEVEQNQNLRVIEQPAPLEFDAAGNLF